MSGAPQRRPSPGYTLVALVVIVAVMNVMVAAALPYWSQIIKRDKEAELIFRGLQYAEAIRVFQKRFNRLPNTLDELIEVNPRSIRRLWKDPMSDSGDWQVIRAAAARPAGGQQQGRELTSAAAPGGRGEERADTGRSGDLAGQPTGPIIGVRSTSEESASRSFMGSQSYAEWKFTVELIPTPVPIPDTLLVPRPTSEWIGKPFRDGLEVPQPASPGRDLGSPAEPRGDGQG